MPNWVMNQLTANGEPKELKEVIDLVTSLEGEYEGHTLEETEFDFNNIVPQSREEFEMINDTRFSKSGLDSCTYHSIIWGTKWNACNVEGPLPEQCRTGEICWFFNTAWAPPTPVILTLAALFPKVTFEHVWHEDSMDEDRWEETEFPQVSSVMRLRAKMLQERRKSPFHSEYPEYEA